MGKVYILNSKRTAIGKVLGSFYECNVTDVCVQLANELLNGYQKKDVDEVIFGNVISAGLGQGIARAIAMKSNIPS